MNGLVTSAAESHDLFGFRVVRVMTFEAFGCMTGYAKLREREPFGSTLRFGFLSVFLAIFNLISKIPVPMFAVRFPGSPSEKVWISLPVGCLGCVATRLAYIRESIRAGVHAVKLRQWFIRFAFGTFLGGHGVTTSLAGSRQGLAPGGFIHYSM